MNLTDRPDPPDCDAWPKCGCDVTGRPCARLPGSTTTVPAPPRTPAEDAAVYLRALDALDAARATERRALACLTEESMQMVARALNARDARAREAV